MSVRVRVELLVTGIDDPEAVGDALRTRDRYYWPEFGDAIWHALTDVGAVDIDVETESVDCESES